MNGELLALDTKLFLDGCDVTILEGEEARAALAEALAGEGLVLEEAK